MQNISLQGGDNLGGLALFYYIPVESIIRMPAAVGNRILSDIEVKPGATWYAFGCSQGTLQYREPETVDRYGKKYKMELKGYLPKDTPALSAALAQLSGRKFVILYQDHNGYYKVVGSPAYYLTFERDLDTGNSPSGKNGVNISFKGENIKPAAFYYGSFNVSEIGIIHLDPPTPQEPAPPAELSVLWGKITGSITNQVDLVKYVADTFATKIAQFWTEAKQTVQTFAAKITFSTAPRFSSTTPNQYLKVDANRDLTSVDRIPAADVEGLDLLLKTKEDKGVAQGLVTALENSLRDGVAVDGNTLAKLRAMISTLQVSDNNLAGQLATIQSILQSDDTNLDTVQEIISFIKNNKDVIDSISTNKLDKAIYNAFVTQYALDIAAKLNWATAAADGDYAPADNNNVSGFFAGMLNSGKLKIKAALDSLVAKARLIGDTSSLATTDKSTLVAAINEVRSTIPTGATSGAVQKRGTFNATTGQVTPTGSTATAIPAPVTGNKGWYYVVDTAGTYLGISYAISDWIVSDGTSWSKVDNTDTVLSVNSKVGAVQLNAVDIPFTPPPTMSSASTNVQLATQELKVNISTLDNDQKTLKIYKATNFNSF